METSLWLFRACMDIRGSIAGLDSAPSCIPSFFWVKLPYAAT